MEALDKKNYGASTINTCYQSTNQFWLNPSKSAQNIRNIGKLKSELQELRMKLCQDDSRNHIKISLTK